jgi:hypothetical protein
VSLVKFPARMFCVTRKRETKLRALAIEWKAGDVSSHSSHLFGSKFSHVYRLASSPSSRQKLRRSLVNNNRNSLVNDIHHDIELSTAGVQNAVALLYSNMHNPVKSNYKSSLLLGWALEHGLDKCIVNPSVLRGTMDRMVSSSMQRTREN